MGLRSFWQFLVIFLAMVWLKPLSAEEALLPADKAFSVALHREEPSRATIHLHIAPNHYIYQHSIRLEHNGQVIPLELPASQEKKDPHLGVTRIYVTDTLLSYQANQVFTLQDRLQVFWQGCSVDGICYVPQHKEFILTPTGFSPSPLKRVEKESILSTFSRFAHGFMAAEDHFSRPFWQIMVFFYFAGLMLAFTACMYPLIPIVSSLIVGGSTNSYRRAFSLSLVYVQAMAMVYAGMGALAAFSGELLSVYLQKPWVLLSLAFFFVVMAIATLGIFHIQMPNQWQSWLMQKTRHLPKGKYYSAGILGIVSALIIGPCVAPPLAAALAYIGKEGNLLLGMTALYMLALGMGTPLLIIGVLGQHILPRLSFTIMRIVRGLLAGILLLSAVWIALPVIVEGNSLIKFDGSRQNKLLQGSASHKQITSISDLNAALLAHRGQRIMLYVTADWCSVCQEMDAHTFANDEVKSVLKEWVFLTLDLSEHSAQHRDLLKRCQLYGPPGVVFFDRKGRMLSMHVIGKQAPHDFLQTLAWVKREIG